MKALPCSLTLLFVFFPSFAEAQQQPRGGNLTPTLFGSVSQGVPTGTAIPLSISDAIDRALKRMDAGTYVVCVPAGRRLSVERLEAIPYAEECVDCKARAERRR